MFNLTDESAASAAVSLAATKLQTNQPDERSDLDVVCWHIIRSEKSEAIEAAIVRLIENLRKYETTP